MPLADPPRPTARALQRLAALAEIELRSHGNYALEDVLRRVARVATALLPSDGGASVLLWDPETQSFALSASTVAEEQADKTVRRVRRSGGASRWIVDERRPLVVEDIEEDPFTANRLLRDSRLRAYAGVPIVFDDEVLGVLYALSRDPRRYTADDLDFLQVLAGRAGTAIAHARLEARLRRALDETEALLRVSSALIRHHDLRTALPRIADVAAEVFSGGRVLLLLLDREAEEVREIVTGGPDADRLGRYDYRTYMDGLTGAALRSGEALLSSGGEPDAREGDEPRRLRGENRIGSVMVAPLGERGAELGTLTVLRDPGEPDFDPGDLRVLEAVANQAALAINRARLFEEVQTLATRDELTGVRNRRELFRLGAVELARSGRAGRPLAAMLFDIDHFKGVNDRFGHACGDQVLREIARRVEASVRQGDVVARYGGEEFAVLLPDADLDAATALAERLAERVRGAPVATDAGPVRVTVSIGVVQAWSGVADLASLLDRADTALYEAKNAGRDRVVAAAGEA